jgi:hypothetical protein
MTRTSVAIFGLLCSSALAAAAPQTRETQLFKPSPSAPRPAVALPPVQSVRTLFIDESAKPAARPNDRWRPRFGHLPAIRTGSVGGKGQIRKEYEGDAWVTCGMTVLLGDPNLDPKSLKKHSSEGFPTRRIEPKTCK